MCGVAGFVSLTGPRDRAGLTRLGRTMTGVLGHRGPDDRGVHVSGDGRVMLANTRLAVRDLSAAGHQPMASPDGAVVLAYNGELYRNRGAPRSRWPARSGSDTEVLVQVLHAASDPAGSLAALDGMFAAAWHDTRTGRVVLARDHFGVKPLVYAVVDGGVLFASEPVALFASGLLAPAFDATTFLAKAYVRMDAADDRTWFAGVRVLPPAHLLVLDPDTGAGAGAVRPRPYWTPAVADEPVTPEQVRAAFDEAVRLRLPSDVPQAALVSGGFDSSAGFGALCRLGGQVRPYVVRYEGPGVGQNDDLPYAQQAVRFWGREPVLCDVRVRDLPGLVDRVVTRLGRPLLHGAELAMHCSYQRVLDEGGTVVYSGHGADELWGYQDGRYFPIVAPDFRPDMHSPYYLRHLLYRQERPGWHRMLDRLAAALGVPDDEITERVWSVTLAAYRELDTLDPHKRGRYHLMRRFLVYVNDMVDGLSSGFSLEDRPLFQDVQLAELAFGMPEYVKNREGPTDFKPFLKQALRDLVPESVLTRPKQGFPAPDDPAYRDRLRALVIGAGLPGGLALSAGELAELGIGELMFLYSTRRWLDLYALPG
ncbi:MAG: asparagine synthetase B family protein [Mycobacteriales bacterium]